MEPHRDLSLKNGPLLTKGEAAQLLGISLAALNKWIGQKRLPVVKLGDSPQCALRLRLSDLDRFVSEHEIPAKERK